MIETSDVGNEVGDGGAVRLITMDDGKANVFSKERIATLRAAIDDAEADKAIGAVVIAGREGMFSGGFDLAVMLSDDIAAIIDLVSDGGDLVRHIFGAEIPIVAACTGHAIAAGALLLLGADVRVGTDGPFKIGFNEVSIGMVIPDWGMTIARERLSKRHLQRAVANARIVDSTTAVDVGFLDLTVPPDQVIETAVEEAATLAALDSGAYRGTMAAFRADTIDMMAKQIETDRNRVIPG